MANPIEDSSVPADVIPTTGADHPAEGAEVDATASVVRERLIVVLQQDFREVSRKAFELKEQEKTSRGDPMRSMGYAMALTDISFDETGRFVWYDGREGFMPEVPIGKPDDYLEIRDDYEALKGFVARALDRGRVHAGGGTHGDSSRETNCADYVTWLHRHNENQTFRQNLERAVFELLGQEFDREFVPLDVDSEIAREEGVYRPPFFHAVGDINDALYRVGLKHNVQGEEDKKFRDVFVEEMNKTERPITKEEYVAGFAGSEKDKIRQFETGEFAREYKVVHFEETSPEFQAALKDFLVRKKAMEAAVRNFSPQFNRLIGLLDVVSSVGEHDSKFAEVYALLKQKAEERFMMDSPAIAHHYSATDVYRSVLIALSSVQQDGELQSFWLDNVENDPDAQRVIASVHGLLTITEGQETRRQQIPALLARLKRRQFDMDVEYQHLAPIGFYFDKNFLNDVLRYITVLCYSRDTFHHLDKEAGTLDFLQDRKVGVGNYDFSFTQFTPEGESKLSASFDLAGNSVGGSTELEAAIRAYFDRNGYELSNDVRVTSLEGRKISDNKTQIVEPGEASVGGWYEGFVGLNHTHFAFLYDEKNGTVLVAKPTGSRSVAFGVRGGLVERRKGFDTVASRLPYAQFRGLAEVGDEVNTAIAEKRSGGQMGDSLYSLDGKLSDELTPHLVSVIHGRLIKNGDGLVE
ncbi:MAG: hypothetical protein AAB592_04640 [Patescibacteria group bacterium]